MEICLKSLYMAITLLIYPVFGGDARNFYAENKKIGQLAKENTVKCATGGGDIDAMCHMSWKSSRMPRDNTKKGVV